MGIGLPSLSHSHDFATEADHVLVLENTRHAKIFSCQLIWANLTGTLDAVIKLQGSNDNVNFEDLGSQKTLDTANGSAGLTDKEFPYEHCGIDIKKNGITGGTLTLKLLAK